jgi:hypothetical protein
LLVKVKKNRGSDYASPDPPPSPHQGTPLPKKFNILEGFFLLPALLQNFDIILTLMS